MPRQDKRHHLEVPEGLQEFLQAFVITVLRNKPDDLLELVGWFLELMNFLSKSTHNMLTGR